PARSAAATRPAGARHRTPGRRAGRSHPPDRAGLDVEGRSGAHRNRRRRYPGPAQERARAGRPATAPAGHCHAPVLCVRRGLRGPAGRRRAGRQRRVAADRRGRTGIARPGAFAHRTGRPGPAGAQARTGADAGRQRRLVGAPGRGPRGRGRGTPRARHRLAARAGRHAQDAGDPCAQGRGRAARPAQRSAGAARATGRTAGTA
ncbi:hypothetical protein HMPREF0005_05996, partial [Achromobacter xylosoxidans C54]